MENSWSQKMALCLIIIRFEIGTENKSGQGLVPTQKPKKYYQLVADFKSKPKEFLYLSSSVTYLVVFSLYLDITMRKKSEKIKQKKKTNIIDFDKSG